MSSTNSTSKEQKIPLQGPESKPNVLSITGHRSESGTVSNLAIRRTSSSDDLAPAPPSDDLLGSPGRNRANTAPPSVLLDSNDGSNVGTKKISPLAAAAPASKLSEDDQSKKQPLQRALSEDDEELRIAKAMALAIQSNPHMSPDEIRQLVGAPPSVVSAQQQPSQQQQSFFNMFQAPSFQPPSFDISTMMTSDVAKKGEAHFRNLGKTLGVTFMTGEDESSSSSHQQSDMDALAAPSAASTQTVSKIKSEEKKAAPAKGLSVAVPIVKPASADLSTSLSSRGSVTSQTNKSRNPFRKSSPRSPPTIPGVVVGQGGDTSKPDSIELERGPIQQTVSEVSSAPDENPQPASTTRPLLPIGNALRNAMTQISGGGAGSNRSSLTFKSDPIRLSGIAWKRRGGMGKFATSAWELRRIELVGTRLLYYRNESEEGNLIVDEGAARISPKDEAALGSAFVPQASDDPSKDQEGIVIAKKATWFEQAASTWVGAGSAAAMDPTSPRGYIDLAKEKATVHAAFGHSGAPSPFAISIKVRNETKWKLCFDQHKTQMEWLAALTDVVVQCSVDLYNASLLAAADPANQIDATGLFTPPTLNKPPSGDKEVSSHRLWMMEPYKIENRGKDAHDDSSSEEESHYDMEDASHSVFDGFDSNMEQADPVPASVATYAVGEPDHSAARDDATENASKTWSIPEGNLVHLAAVVNAALFFARASSTSIEGFWHLVVFTNVGLFFCLVNEPHWKSVLEHVRAAPLLQRASAKLAEKAKTKAAVEKKKKGEAAIPTPAVSKKPGYIPMAGASTVKLKSPTDPPVNSKNQMFAGWCDPPGTIMQVRSHGYMATKAKTDSPGELYECIGVDIFESPERYPDMAKRVKLPQCHFDDGGKPKTWRTPDIFIVSIALPTDPPKFGRSSSDGGGYTVTCYFKMHQDTRDILRRVTAEGYNPAQEDIADPQKSKVNAVRLLEDWCRRAPSDPKWQARFKVVPNAHNLAEIGMPNWIASYNGKPFLIKRAGVTGFLYSHPELSCMEFDVSLHPFPYLAKQAICFMKESYFKKILVSFGFVIEGRTDDELPECLIGLMQLCYPDPAYAIQAKDFFAGTANRSSD